MTVSLDGFVEDADGSADALYPDVGELQASADPTVPRISCGAGLRHLGVAHETSAPLAWLGGVGRGCDVRLGAVGGTGECHADLRRPIAEDAAMYGLDRPLG
jgi:hypothetical protein